MTAKISIIIPTYKPTNLFRETLYSIASQSFSDYELLIVLNGCKEPFNQWIEDWICDLKLSSRTKLIQINTPGVSNARNVGLEYSTGEYICFIDDDDIISENYLAELYSVGLNKSIAFSDVIKFEKSIQEFDSDCIYHVAYNNLKDCNSLNLVRLRTLLNGPWGKLYNRKCIENCKFDTRIKMGEDALFNFNISRYITSVAIGKNNATYFYRIRNTSVSRTPKKVSYYVKNTIKLDKSYSKIYFSHFKEYKFLYFLSRIAATWKFAIVKIKNKNK